MYLQSVVPSLALTIKGTTAIQNDVLATKQPECPLSLEWDVERVSLPVWKIRGELDSSLHVLCSLLVRIRAHEERNAQRGIYQVLVLHTGHVEPGLDVESRDEGTVTVGHAEFAIAASNAGPSSDPLAVSVHDVAAGVTAAVATLAIQAVHAKRVRM